MAYQPFTNPLSITVGVGGIVDGGNVVEGATTDTAVTGDSPGTISGKLRGLVKILTSVWDSINGRLIVDASKTVITANILNIPPVTVANFPVTQAVSGTVTVANFPASAGTPLTTQQDGQLLDDDGIPYVNPNVPGADIATGDRQNQIISLLAQNNALTRPVTIQGTIPVSLPSVLAPNASIEVAGNLQRVADLLESMLLELRVSTALMTQLGQPVQDGPEQLRNDFNLSIQ